MVADLFVTTIISYMNCSYIFKILKLVLRTDLMSVISNVLEIAK